MKPTPTEAPVSASTRTLDRGLRILDVLKDRGSLTLTEIASDLDLDKSTVYRMLGTLATRLYVERQSDGRWRLAVRLIEHARRVTADSELYRIGLPYLQRLREATRESANLAVLHGELIVWLAVLDGDSPIRATTPAGIGAGMPHCTASGKAVLAYLPQDEVDRIVDHSGLPARTHNTITTMDELRADLQRTRERGFAFDDMETMLGLRCVATPLFGPAGRVVGAISVSGPALRFEVPDRWAPMLSAASVDISRSMGADESTLMQFWSAIDAPPGVPLDGGDAHSATA
jgi:DNA-binding IclR family transcriptional regulator